MTTEAALLRAIAASTSEVEQRRLVRQLDDFRANRAARRADANSLDFDYDRPAPQVMGRAHSTYRHESDWILDLETRPEKGFEHKVRAQATLWFQKLSNEVIEDEEEFIEQAEGEAEVEASQYGNSAEAARMAFLTTAARLRRQATAKVVKVAAGWEAIDNVTTMNRNYNGFELWTTLYSGGYQASYSPRDDVNFDGVMTVDGMFGTLEEAQRAAESAADSYEVLASKRAARNHRLASDDDIPCEECGLPASYNVHKKSSEDWDHPYRNQYNDPSFSDMDRIDRVEGKTADSLTYHFGEDEPYRVWVHLPDATADDRDRIDREIMDRGGSVTSFSYSGYVFMTLPDDADILQEVTGQTPQQGPAPSERGFKWSSKTALTVDPDFVAPTCSSCSKPSVYFAFQDGARASGFFACEDHIDDFREGRTVEKFAASRKVAKSIENLTPGERVYLEFGKDPENEYMNPEPDYEYANFLGREGDRATFESVDESDGRTYTWDAYLFEGRWSYGTGADPLTVMGSKTAAPSDGERSFCRICGIEMEGQDYAWYALTSSSPQRNAPQHYHINARLEGRPGEFGPDGVLVPGTPGGEGGQYDAPAGTIWDAGGNAIPITARKTAGKFWIEDYNFFVLTGIDPDNGDTTWDTEGNVENALFFDSEEDALAQFGTLAGGYSLHDLADYEEGGVYAMRRRAEADRCHNCGHSQLDHISSGCGRDECACKRDFQLDPATAGTSLYEPSDQKCPECGGACTVNTENGDLDCDDCGWTDGVLTLGKKQAWTEDGSDITPKANELMDFTNQLEAQGLRRDEVKQQIADTIIRIGDQISVKDLDCLEDYNFHVTVEGVILAMEQGFSLTGAKGRKMGSAHLVYHEDANGDVVDYSTYCSDSCARTNPDYAGWNGALGDYTDVCEKCENCGDWIQSPGDCADGLEGDCRNPACAGSGLPASSFASKTANYWRDEVPWADSQYNDDYSVVPGTSKLFTELEKFIPSMTSPDGKALADFVYEKGAGDSVDRENAFSWAVEQHGWKYDDLYDSWLNTASKTAALTVADIDAGLDDEDHLGFGYASGSYSGRRTLDPILIEFANAAGWDRTTLFQFLNSKDARWLRDSTEGVNDGDKVRAAVQEFVTGFVPPYGVNNI